MIMRPCLHCTLKATCETMPAVKAALKGLPVTVCSVRCKQWYAAFPPGQRVQAEFLTHYGESPDTMAVDGTVTGHKGGKIQVWLDEVLTEGRSPIVKLYPDRLCALDEPLVLVCPECGRPADQQNAEEWHCDSCSVHDGKTTWAALMVNSYLGSDYFADRREAAEASGWTPAAAEGKGET